MAVKRFGIYLTESVVEKKTGKKPRENILYGVYRVDDIISRSDTRRDVSVRSYRQRRPGEGAGGEKYVPRADYGGKAHAHTYTVTGGGGEGARAFYRYGSDSRPVRVGSRS